MQYFLDQLSDKLLYLNEETIGNDLKIFCTVEKLDYHIQGYRYRKLKDINLGDKRVLLIIKLPVYYVDKTSKKHSFIHKLTCCEERARRTIRLNNWILENVKESSAIGFERTIKKTIADVSDSSIVRLVKKNNIILPSMKKQSDLE